MVGGCRWTNQLVDRACVCVCVWTSKPTTMLTDNDGRIPRPVAPPPPLGTPVLAPPPMA